MVRRTIPTLFGIGIWLITANAYAQTAPEKTNETIIQSAPLDAIVLFNAEGKRSIYLPGDWSTTVIDDFQNFLLKDQQNPVPPFVLRDISATGKIAGNHIETTVKIELTTSTTRPVRVPLGFKEGILPANEQEQPLFKYTGFGNAYLTVDPKEKQYIVIVSPQPQTESADSEKPDPQQQHTLNLSVWLPFTQNTNGENKLTVSFPQAVGSQFLLDIPTSGIEASVSQGSLLNVSEENERQTTRLKILGLRSETEITWQKKKEEVINDRPVLLVDKAFIDARLEARSTTCDVTLPISSATGSFDQIQIRLPQGAKLDRETTDKYAADYSISEPNKESVVTVQFLHKVTGLVSVRLKTVQSFDSQKPDFKRDLSGFEVLGAERQAGFLSVTVPSEMKSHWEPIRSVRRVEVNGFNGFAPSLTIPSLSIPSAVPIPPPYIGSSNDARFEFISQPFLLRVQIVSPQARINVKPEYRFRISKGSISMNARFTYTVSGSKTDHLQIALPDANWNCEVGPGNIVDLTTGIEMSDNGIITIPLRGPTDGTFDVELQAMRVLSVDEEQQRQRLVLTLPEPKVTWCEPAPVVIIPANNVEVQPIDESYLGEAKQRTTGLTRQTRRAMSVRIELDQQQEPLFYRTEPTGAVFVADLIYHQQKINVSMQTDVRLLDSSDQITQTVSYDVQYAPVDKLYFLLPKSLDAPDSVQVKLGNRILELRDTVSDSPNNVPENWRRKMVQLPEAAMFRFQLTFQYSVPPITVPADVTALFSLPFIRPADSPVSDHRIYLFTPNGYKIDLHDESRTSWEPFKETRRLATAVAGTFRSAQSPPKISLSVSLSERDISNTTIAERAWLQTWLTNTIRQDRASYIVTSTSNSVTIFLPPDAAKEHRVFVRVDRRPVTADIAPTGLLTIPIMPEQYNRPVEISVDYRYTFETPNAEVSMVLPTFAKETLVQYEFWQIILPQNRHIIGAPTGWTAEFDWTWNGLFWGRIPSIQKRDIGFEPDTAEVEAVIAASSQYLFSNLHPSARATIYVVNRSMIVLYSSGLALLAGLILIYVPQSRFAGSLFGLGLALIAVLLWQPPLVLLVLQASVLGVCLALAAGYVYRICHRQEQWIPSSMPMWDEMEQPINTPLPQPPPAHEVIMDEESGAIVDSG